MATNLRSHLLKGQIRAWCMDNQTDGFDDKIHKTTFCVVSVLSTARSCFTRTRVTLQQSAERHQVLFKTLTNKNADWGQARKANMEKQVAKKMLVLLGQVHFIQLLISESSRITCDQV